MKQLSTDEAIKLVLALVVTLALLAGMTSCSRYITPYEAANGKAKCGRWVR